MLVIKHGVRIRGISTEAVLGLVITHDVYRSIGLDLVLTSATDATHMPNSKHHCGDAFDCRLPPDDQDARALCAMLRNCLGKSFDVVLEKDHIHIEYDPK